MKRRQNPQREVDIWNGRVQVGTAVEYREYPEAAPEIYTTRTAAEVLSGHTSVVWLNGKAGCVSTSACRLPAHKTTPEPT